MSHKIMKNGNNSGGKRALESSLFPVGADNLSNIKNCVARRHGKMDQLVACVTSVIILQLKEPVFSIRGTGLISLPSLQTLCLLVPS